MMITYEKGLELILNSVDKTKTEKVDISSALNRTLAEDVFTDMDVPSFDKSAMDGFAIRQEDIHEELEVIEFVPAGASPTKMIGTNQCSRIMTGGMVPSGADMVLMIEHTEDIGNNRIRFIKESSKSNILKQGEDLKKGEKVLSKGTHLNPAHIGILASVGKVDPMVYKSCKVGILATGTELVSPYETPKAPHIRNSNSYQISALCEENGANATNKGMVDDDPIAIRKTVEELLENHDIVLFTGGASFGDHDFSSQVLKELGAEVKFHLMAIQPGKPVLFATLRDKYLFGLSGNPVSSSVQFQLLVRPLIKKIMGRKELYKSHLLPIAQDMNRKKSERALFFPVKYTETMEVKPLEYHGSAHLNAYEAADAMACFPIGKNELRKGEKVYVRPL